MKKQKKQLIILLVVVLLAAAAFLVSRVVSSKEADKNAESSKTMAISYDSSKVIDIMVTGVAEHHFVKKDGTWYMDGREEEVLDQTTMKLMQNRADQTASDMVLEPDGSENFGLDDPMAVIVLTLSDQTKVKIEIGMENKMKNQYYIRVNDAPEIYLVPTNSLSPYLLEDSYFLAE